MSDKLYLPAELFAFGLVAAKPNEERRENTSAVEISTDADGKRWAVATDGKAAIRVPVRELDEIKSYPPVEKVLKPPTGCETVIRLDAKLLYRLMFVLARMDDVEYVQLRFPAGASAGEVETIIQVDAIGGEDNNTLLASAAIMPLTRK